MVNGKNQTETQSRDSESRLRVEIQNQGGVEEDRRSDRTESQHRGAERRSRIGAGCEARAGARVLVEHCRARVLSDVKRCVRLLNWNRPRALPPPICGVLASAICRVGCGESARAERRRGRERLSAPHALRHFSPTKKIGGPPTSTLPARVCRTPRAPTTQPPARRSEVASPYADPTRDYPIHLRDQEARTAAPGLHRELRRGLALRNSSMGEPLVRIRAQKELREAHRQRVGVGPIDEFRRANPLRSASRELEERSHRELAERSQNTKRSSLVEGAAASVDTRRGGQECEKRRQSSVLFLTQSRAICPANDNIDRAAQPPREPREPRNFWESCLSTAGREMLRSDHESYSYARANQRPERWLAWALCSCHGLSRGAASRSRRIHA